MLGSSIHMHEDILGRTMQAYSLRAQVIQNNIANSDTPGFKKSEVEFESALENALKSGVRKKDIDLESLQANIVLKDVGYSNRLDRNNVDVDEESLKHYENASRFDVLVNSVTFNFKMLNMAVGGK